MLEIKKKKTGIFLVLAIVFTIAWSVWTFYLVPRSETPSLPVPIAPAGNPVH
jgi:hypothetical protein